MITSEYKSQREINIEQIAESKKVCATSCPVRVEDEGGARFMFRYLIYCLKNHYGTLIFALIGSSILGVGLMYALAHDMGGLRGDALFYKALHGFIVVPFAIAFWFMCCIFDYDIHSSGKDYD